MKAALCRSVVTGLILVVLSHTSWGCYFDEKYIENTCERKWELVYAHSEFGDAVVGSKKQLKTDIYAGKDIKVTLVVNDTAYQMRLDSVYMRHEEVCAQSLSHLAHNGTHFDFVSPKRYMMVCTTGLVITLRDSGEQTNEQQAIYWYSIPLTKPSGLPIFSHHLDGSQARGSLQNLWKAAHTMALRGVMRDRGCSFPMHNVAVDIDTGVVTGQNVKEIEKVDSGDVFRFHPNPSFKFSAWSSNGRRDTAHWTVANAQPKGHFLDRASLDWHADTCWRAILQLDETGYPLAGSVQRLSQEVRAGHRVRVTIDNVAYTASNVRISDNVVTAQLLDGMEPGEWRVPTRYDIKFQTARRWILAHSTGTVRRYEVPLKNNKVSRPTVEIKAMVWSVDTRPWKVVLRTEDQGRLVVGTPPDLINAVRQGVSIRINLGMDEIAKDFLTDPDSIRIDEEQVVYAHAMNHISDTKAVDLGEYELQEDAFHWYLMISSKGSVRMSAWYVNRETEHYNKWAPAANVTWLVNQ